MIPFSTPISNSELTLLKLPLAPLGIELRQEKGYASSGRAARSLIRGDNLTVVLVALREGASLQEHPAPGPAVVTVLEGSVLFRGPEEGEPFALGALDSVVFPTGLRHAVESVQDSLLQIVIGGRE